MRLHLLFLLVIFSLSCKYTATETKRLTGKVIGITDGDTFILLMENKRKEKIRLYGIDCPERRQPFGTVAKQRLSDLIFSRSVEVEVKSHDRWKRVVGIVFLKGQNINTQMLKDGYAWHFKRYDANVEWDGYEKKARRDKLGLWVDSNAVEPWNWRAGK